MRTGARARRDVSKKCTDHVRMPCLTTPVAFLKLDDSFQLQIQLVTTVATESPQWCDVPGAHTVQESHASGVVVGDMMRDKICIGSGLVRMVEEGDWTCRPFLHGTHCFRIPTPQAAPHDHSMLTPYMSTLSRHRQNWLLR